MEKKYEKNMIFFWKNYAMFKRDVIENFAEQSNNNYDEYQNQQHSTAHTHTLAYGESNICFAFILFVW